MANRATGGALSETPFRWTEPSTWTPWQQVYISYSLMGLQLLLSSALILLNKWLLSTANFGFPIILSSMGMLVSAGASYVLVDVMQLVRVPDETRRLIDARFQLTRIQPVAVVAAITLSTGNYAYVYLSVSIIQVLKSFTPVLTLLLLVSLGMSRPSRKLVASVCIITAGCVLAARSEVEAAGATTLFGLCIFFSSECAECTRVVILDYLLRGAGQASKVKLNGLTTLYYVAPYTFAWCQVGALALEWPSFAERGGYQTMAQYPIALSCAAMMGFGVNLCAFLVIQTARGGSLTFKAAQTAKNAMLVWVSVLLFGNTVSSNVIIGYAISLVGFGWYTVLQAQQKAADDESLKLKTDTTPARVGESKA